MSSKPRPIFTEMPWNIKQDIIDSTDFRTRCVLRKCTKALRYQVNNSDFTLFSIDFILGSDKVQVRMIDDDKESMQIDVDYRLEVDGCSVNGKFIRGENYIDRSVADFAAVARHPRTLVREVLAYEVKKVRGDKIAFMRAFEKKFTSFPLRIESFEFYLKASQQDQMRMLTLTRPGVLKNIRLEPIVDNQDASEIITSEHWRSARRAVMFGFANIPARSLVHFHEVYVQDIRITKEDAKVFTEKIFEFGESFNQWHFCWSSLESEAFKYFSSEFAHRTEEDVHYFFKKMPDTMYHLRIQTKLAQSKNCVKFSKVLSSEVEA